jgi:predicted GNAT superfamily acetyltransferase
VENRPVRGRTSTVELEVVRAADLESAETELLLRIPLDFYSMLRETDVEDPEIRRIPLDWRLVTRNAFQTLLARGYRVSDFLSRKGSPPANSYLLRKR